MKYIFIITTVALNFVATQQLFAPTDAQIKAQADRNKALQHPEAFSNEERKAIMARAREAEAELFDSPESREIRARAKAQADRNKALQQSGISTKDMGNDEGKAMKPSSRAARRLGL